MNLTSKKVIQNLLRKYQTYPLKRLGQNFLIDRGAIKKIIKAADLKARDIVLEIGPGIGILTIELAEKVKQVVTIEKDPKMVKILKEVLKDFKNVEIIQGDILKSKISKLKTERYKIVANLPFYLTAPVIRQSLESSKVQPRKMVLVVQKEVAQRICSRPPRMSILAVSVQLYAQPKIISYISKKSFWPSPKVDSAILKMSVLKQPENSVFNQQFFKIVKAGFAHPRKQLINNLASVLKINREKTRDWLLKNNLRPTQRAQTLTIRDWVKLTKSFSFMVK